MAYNLKGDVAVERRMDTGILGIPEWRASTRYKAGDLMRVGTTYRVRKTDGTSGLTYDAAESVDWGDVSDPVWEFTTNNIQTLAAHWYIVDGAHTVLMPVAPADGASVRFASPVEWSTRGATFTAAGATTVGAGQTGMFAGYDVIEMTYSATADNWVVHVGSGSAPQADTIENLNATGTVTAWGSVVVIGATAPTANMVLTLPTAAGNTGKTIKLVRVDNTAFTVTLAAQVGETVTLLSTGTELNTQHGSLTVEATTATAIRQVAQVSAGAASPVASFLRGSRSSGQSVASHNAVVFTAVDASAGTDISLNTTNGQITLKAGKTYRLTGSVVSSITSAQRTQWRWLNLTAGGLGIGAAQVFYSPADTAANSASGSPATAIISPSVDTVVLLQNTSLLTSDVGGNPDFGGAGASVNPWFEVEVIGGQESAVVVPVTPLHYAAVIGQPNNHVDNVATVVGAGYTVVSFTDTTILSVYNPSGIVNTAANTIDIVQAGAYEIIFGGRTASFDIAIRVNGVEVSGTDAGNPDYQTTTVIRDLAPGDRIEFALQAGTPAGNTNIQSPSATVKQLPSSTVVDPGLITPTPLHWAQLRRNDGLQGNVSDWVAGTRVGSGTTAWSTVEGSGAVASANGTITLAQAGRYLIEAQINDFDSSASTNAVWQLRSNGTALHTTGFETVTGADPFYPMSIVADLPAGAVLDLFPSAAGAGAGTKRLGSGSFFRATQLPSSTVVDPGAVTVNDQAASGYIDLGGVRFQWGQLTNTSDSAQLVTLPAAFASTAYSLSLTPDDGWSVGAGEVTPWKWSGKTTTTFNVDRDDDVTGTALVDWIAIGRKP